MVKKISTILKEIAQDASWLTISNLLTLSRIILTPVVVFSIYKHWWLFAFVLFIVAGLSDMFDGFFARLLHEQTVLGTYLDPVADKILLISSFTALALVDSPSMPIPLWFVWIVLMREIIIISGASFLVLIGSETQVKPTIYGKLTTFFQLTFILWLFICYFFGWNPIKTYSILIVFLALFSIASLGHYMIGGWRCANKFTKNN